MKVFVGSGPAPAFGRYQEAFRSLEAAKREGERRVNTMKNMGDNIYTIEEELSWDESLLGNGKIIGRFTYCSVPDGEVYVGTIEIWVHDLADE